MTDLGSEAAADPWVMVHCGAARGACEAAGKRLCTPVEWGFACGGITTQAYPYGPDHEAGWCNDGAGPGELWGTGSGEDQGAFGGPVG